MYLIFLFMNIWELLRSIVFRTSVLNLRFPGKIRQLSVIYFSAKKRGRPPPTQGPNSSNKMVSGLEPLAKDQSQTLCMPQRHWPPTFKYKEETTKQHMHNKNKHIHMIPLSLPLSLATVSLELNPGTISWIELFSLLWRHEHTHKHTQLGEEAGNGDSTDQEHTTRGHECEPQEANRVYAFQPETKLYKESPDPNRYRGP